MLDGQIVPGSLYVYAPNHGAPIFFAVVFSISAVGHIWQCSAYRAWQLIWLHPLCAILFTAGYTLRAISSYNNNYIFSLANSQPLLLFIMGQVFIYICPPLLELSNYHVLGRVFAYAPYVAPLDPRYVSSIFGLLLMVVEALNGVGVSLSANPTGTASSQEMGRSLTLASLVLQMTAIAIFFTLSVLFHRRCTQNGIRSRSVIVPLMTLYASMFLILVRSLYRLVEHVGNTAINLTNPAALATLSPLLRYEVFLFIFEAGTMFLNSALWNIWHPGRYLPRRRYIHLARDGMTEVTDEDEAAMGDASFLDHIISELTFGLFNGRKQSRQMQTRQAATGTSGSAANGDGRKSSEWEWPPLMIITCLLTLGIVGRPKRRQPRTQSADEELTEYRTANARGS